jgi:DNA-binding MarR family transcriptional regulator
MPRIAEGADYMLADSIGYQVRLASTALRRSYVQLLADAGITASPEQVTLLTLLARGDEWTPTEMAAANGHDKASVTRMLQAMQEAGWVTVEPHPSSGTRKRARITPAGRTLLARVDTITKAKELRLEAGLSRAELESLFASLRKLREAAEREA